MEIDLVYLWVDGNDPEWNSKKMSYLNQGISFDPQAIDKARFFNNDELKYSLRSAELFAPWIRHIYIVTYNQIPSWLDTENPKISIVDHSEILPADALPSFNSVAIEWGIDKIPGLSEHFLYANDDTFFAQTVTPDFFFNEKGYPIVRLKQRHHPHVQMQYMKTIIHSQQLIKQMFGKDYTYHEPHHNIDAYCKSDITAFKEMFAGEIDATIRHRFRDDTDLQRSVILYYALAIGHGTLRITGRFNKPMSTWGYVKSSLTKQYNYDSRYIAISAPDYDYILKRYNPTLICMNDDEKSDDQSRRRAKAFMEKKFPKKSSFEK